MRILIADDHPLFAEGLKNLLSANDFEIIDIVKDGEKVVEVALEEKPDVILMDIEMPVINGIEATRKLKEQLPEINIIILTSFEEEDSLINAVKAGASGYLLKSLDGEELIASLTEFKQGKNPFSPGLEGLLLNEIRKTDNKKPDKGNNSDWIGENKQALSERQLEVIRLLAKGLTYQEIGERLFISERTIKYHMEQIKKRLGLKTQAQIIAYARENI